MGEIEKFYEERKPDLQREQDNLYEGRQIEVHIDKVRILEDPKRCRKIITENL